MSNRRGNVMDTITIIGILFGVMIVAVLGVYLSNTINNAIQNSTMMPTNAKTMTNNLNSDFPGAVDFIILMVMIGLPIVSVILAFFNNIHPLFFYLSLAFLVIIVMCGYAYQGLWSNFTTGTLSGAANSMPMTNFILSHFTMYAILVACIILFGTYVKAQNQANYYG